MSQKAKIISVKHYKQLLEKYESKKKHYQKEMGKARSRAKNAHG